MKPDFTQEQKDWICYQIGEWYLNWKNTLISWDDRTHRLGYAKENLKYMVCDDFLCQYCRHVKNQDEMIRPLALHLCKVCAERCNDDQQTEAEILEELQ